MHFKQYNYEFSNFFFLIKIKGSKGEPIIFRFSIIQVRIHFPRYGKKTCS